MSGLTCYSYASTKLGADPAKTVFLCAPDADARTVESARAFAESSGWVDVVERDAAVLVAPVVPEGWAAAPDDLPVRLYRELRGTFPTAPGKGIPGSGDRAWTWEVLVYVAGYSEGASYAGTFLLAHPGFAAATALVDGRAERLDVSELPSEHLFVSDPSGYRLRNADVPVAAWLMGAETDDGAMLRRLVEIDGAVSRKEVEGEGFEATVHFNPDRPAQQVWVSPRLGGADPRLPEIVMGSFFDTVVRWKDGPDGTVSPHLTKREFFEGGAYLHSEVRLGENAYHYVVYLPRGEARRGLALVVSLHGRGEPSWVFAQKNGWEALADETGEFGVLIPDSPRNVWCAERDGDALELMVRRVVDEHGFDPTRVYLTGFSNGALFTCQMATSRPELFAAASPWNSPGLRALEQGGLGGFLYGERLAKEGFEMPFWVVYGDSDEKAPAVVEDGFREILRANGCREEPSDVWTAESRYTEERGYAQGRRLRTEVYADGGGRVMAGVTIASNTPHGAFPDEARACWEFVSGFSRPSSSRKVR